MNEASGNMTTELSTGSATAGQIGTGHKAASWLRTTLQVIAGSALIAICAHIALPLPWTPVPLTLQTFAVLLLGLLLGPAAGAAAAALYLLEGAVGLPVFSPAGPLGIAHLIGPTGGYLLAYPAAAWLTGWLGTRTWFSRQLAAAILGSVVILLVGGLWLSVLTHASLRITLFQAVVPFLPGDALKCVAAAAIAAGWMRWKPQQ
jgi:biotin transport system substrate-specific component